MKRTADGRQQTAASQPETTEDLTDPEEKAKVRRMIERHAEYTESAVARRALNDWHETRGQFVKVMPTEYREALEAMEQNGEARESLVGGGAPPQRGASA